MAQALRQKIRSLLVPRIGGSVSKQSAILARRTFSSSAAQHEDAEESVKWRNITVAGYIVCTALGIYNFTGGHEETEERKPFSYLRIRNKEFPWGPDGLFEYPHENHEH